MTPDDELHRLNLGTPVEDVADGTLLVTYAISTAGDATVVLDRIRSVLVPLVYQAVRTRDGERWPELDEWRERLPDWFVYSFGSGPISAENGRRSTWLRRSRGQADTDSESGVSWTLDGWLSWLEPDERQWYWWSADAEDSAARIVVEVEGWPYPDGALRWLLTSAGAETIEADDSLEA